MFCVSQCTSCKVRTVHRHVPATDDDCSWGNLLLTESLEKKDISKSAQQAKPTLFLPEIPINMPTCRVLMTEDCSDSPLHDAVVAWCYVISYRL